MNNSYGSKRGLFNSVVYKLLFWFRVYRQHQNIDFEKVDHLVFVCSGNICRSSLAEYVAKSLGVSSESYGLHCRGGDKADPRAIDYASRKGLNMTEHRTRNIKEYNAKASHLIIAMEPAHLKELDTMNFEASQVTTLPIWTIQNIYLHDPFCASPEFFKRCEDIVFSGVENLASKLSNKSL